ncbi:hypothetical protein EHQ92_17510 [Leptospira biflexa]|uniref:hypothetical protein n=1 Tax=Leptospira biflexa TaxID=172 RepID=UPI001090EE78|nr:hypothetical protein [Leptospira biflexa]TGM42583.1 hypothetical protein EHQ92_17510 [Leptospira biflexa]TGM44469.1 hypothetical protein EHQ88_17845 [Leptospira biflexa]
MFLFLIYPLLLFFVANGIDRSDTISILSSTFSLGLYFFFLQTKLYVFENRFWMFLCYSVILRCFVLGSHPNLSDDIYRYLFDAKLLFNGFSPYMQTPSAWIIANQMPFGDMKELLTNMNSPNYFSVYPLLLLSIFSIGFVLNSLLQTQFLGIQIIFLLFDFLNLNLIRRYYPKESFHFYWIYFANPLVIIEGVSQMHPEILFVPWLLVFVQTNHLWIRELAMIILTQFKINTVLFLLGFSHQRKKILYGAFGILLSLVVWKITVFSNLESQGSRGIGLFFHSFRFAGILEPIFYIPLHSIGYSYLSGILSLSTFAFLLINLFLYEKFLSLPIERRLFLLYTIFLLFSPVIHSWYWILFVILGMICRINPILQTLVIILAFLSYLIYVSELYFYLYWILSLIGFGIYGIKEINYLRKTAIPWQS